MELFRVRIKCGSIIMRFKTQAQSLCHQGPTAATSWFFFFEPATFVPLHDVKGLKYAIYLIDEWRLMHVTKKRHETTWIKGDDGSTFFFIFAYLQQYAQTKPPRRRRLLVFYCDSKQLQTNSHICFCFFVVVWNSAWNSSLLAIVMLKRNQTSNNIRRGINDLYIL